MVDMHTSTSTRTHETTRRTSLFRWRTVDLVSVAMLGVAIGLVFWGWSQLYHVISAVATVAFPPIAGLLTGPWLLGGVVGALVVRKPGAAIATEVVAASVEALLGNGWGLSNLVVGAIQGAGVEIVLAVLLFRRFGVLAAMAAAAASAVLGGLYSWAFYYTDWAAAAVVAYLALFVVSGVLTSGLLGWLLVRGLARTGVLDAFEVGRELADRQAA